jgi:hypothetical protein
MLFVKEQQQVNIEMTYSTISETNSPSGDVNVSDVHKSTSQKPILSRTSLQLHNAFIFLFVLSNELFCKQSEAPLPKKEWHRLIVGY